MMIRYECKGRCKNTTLIISGGIVPAALYNNGHDLAGDLVFCILNGRLNAL